MSCEPDLHGGEAIFPFATLVLVDMRHNHCGSSPCPLIGDAVAASVLENCRIALRFARRSRWQVAFVCGSCGLAASDTRPWIDGLEPHRLDALFDRRSVSCYSSPLFASAMADNGGAILVAGFLGTGGMLATAMDAALAGHRIGFLSDAVRDPVVETAFGPEAVRLHRMLAGIGAGLTTTLAWTRSVERFPFRHDGRQGWA